MKYKYEGKFRSEEHGMDDYSPPEVIPSFYCHIYPEETDIHHEGAFFGKSVLRARVTPLSISEVKLSGFNRTFEIKHFNSDYALLQEKVKGRSAGKKFLVTIETIEENGLRIRR